MSFYAKVTHLADQGKAGDVGSSLKPSIASWSGQGTVPLSTALVWPHLEHWEQLWVPQYVKGIRLLECVQRRETNMVKGLKGSTSTEWQRSFGWFSLEKRRLRGDLMAAYTFLKAGSRGESADLLALVGQR